MRAKNVFSWMVLVLLAAGTAASADAQTAAVNPSFVISESKVTTEKVEAVDYATRKVTLRDASGAVRVVKVGTDIHNFSKVKIDDVVTIETFLTLSVEVKPGPGNAMNVGYEGQTAPLPGEKPTGVRTIEGTLRTRIEAIDYDKRTITFKGRDGALKTYQLGPEAKRFNEIKRNDMLWIEYSQTIKMTVQ